MTCSDVRIRTSAGARESDASAVGENESSLTRLPHPAVYAETFRANERYDNLGDTHELETENCKQ